jgi:hypothetical protein
MKRQFALLKVTIPTKPQTEDDFEVMANAWDSLMAFLNCETQWRIGMGMAGIVWFGLDYTACKIVLENIDAPRHTFADLRVMEAEAMKILNEGER